MTIQEMKRKKEEKGYSYVKIAELSGVPLGTVQKVFSGETEHPRYETLQALESLFVESDCVRETPAYNVKQQGQYTIEDYYALPEEQRVELIDGYFYEMSAPTTIHQKIVIEFVFQIASYIRKNNGKCEVFASPVDVQLDCDNKTMVQPDVVIICKEERLEYFGIYGAPDFILEILSPATKRKDCIKKLAKYENAGVREYWILDPMEQRLMVYFYESEVYPLIYGLEESVPVNIYEGKLQINLQGIGQWIDAMEKKRKQSR